MGGKEKKKINHTLKCEFILLRIHGLEIKHNSQLNEKNERKKKIPVMFKISTVIKITRGCTSAGRGCDTFARETEGIWRSRSEDNPPMCLHRQLNIYYPLQVTDFDKLKRYPND